MFSQNNYNIFLFIKIKKSRRERPPINDPSPIITPPPPPPPPLNMQNKKFPKNVIDTTWCDKIVGNVQKIEIFFQHYSFHHHDNFPKGPIN